MGFSYSNVQIAAVVNAVKHPRLAGDLEIKESREPSRRLDSLLERSDAKEDRIRLIVRAGRIDDPHSFAAALLLEDTRIRGIDYHAVARSRFYKETIPKGWHEDIIDPNRETGEKGQHERKAMPDFAPMDFVDFRRLVCAHWNIVLPPELETML